MFELLQKGHIKPIFPIKTFPFEDIPSAFRYMRGANHIGKIVISNGHNYDISVPVSLETSDRISRVDIECLDSRFTADTQPEE